MESVRGQKRQRMANGECGSIRQSMIYHRSLFQDEIVYKLAKCYIPIIFSPPTFTVSNNILCV